MNILLEGIASSMPKLIHQGTHFLRGSRSPYAPNFWDWGLPLDQTYLAGLLRLGSFQPDYNMVGVKMCDDKSGLVL
jgi:hypothetical protein